MSVPNFILSFKSCNDNSIIDSVILHDSNLYDTLVSCTGEKIKIANLNCSSYEEFIVALDVYNCLHSFNTKDMHQNSRHSKDSNVAKLMLENAKLKKQLETIKNLVKTV